MRSCSDLVQTLSEQTQYNLSLLPSESKLRTQEQNQLNVMLGNQATKFSKLCEKFKTTEQENLRKE